MLKLTRLSVIQTMGYIDVHAHRFPFPSYFE